MSSQSGLAAGEPAASSNDAAVEGSVDSPGRDPNRPDNPWNMFQHAYKGLGLNSRVLSRLYRDQKTHQPKSLICQMAKGELVLAWTSVGIFASRQVKRRLL